MSGLRQIWTDTDYVYAATSSGLDVINIATEQTQSFASEPAGYNTVWADEDYVFVGTTNSGIKFLAKSAIGPADISSELTIYAQSPDLVSNNVKYVHGNSTKLICCTLDGVNIIRRDSHYITKATVSGASKCFVTPDYDYFYYLVSGTNDWTLNRLNENRSDWYNADIIYTTGSGFLENVTEIKDFYVTEHTSTSGNYNTLFLATDNGAYVYDEFTTDYLIFTTIS